MSAPTLYQHYKALARLVVFQAAHEAITDQGEATRAAFRGIKRAFLFAPQTKADLERFDRIAARLSARAIRIAQRERAAAHE